jgi:hypothetical protein
VGMSVNLTTHENTGFFLRNRCKNITSRLCYPGLILSDSPPFGVTEILQQMVPITGKPVEKGSVGALCGAGSPFLRKSPARLIQVQKFVTVFVTIGGR